MVSSITVIDIIIKSYLELMMCICTETFYSLRSQGINISLCQCVGGLKVLFFQLINELLIFLFETLNYFVLLNQCLFKE